MFKIKRQRPSDVSARKQNYKQKEIQKEWKEGRKQIINSIRLKTK